jgi:hypothetical protein
MNGLREVPELSDEDGAKRLKLSLETYWSNRGYAIVVTLVEKKFIPQMRACWWEVQTNLINGLPPEMWDQLRQAA